MSKSNIQLIYLPKQYGGRIDANTFRGICASRTNENTSAWLQGIKRLNTPGNENNYMITSIIKAIMNSFPVIVKIQEPGRLYNKETHIMQLLTDQNIPNIIHHICDFSCNDDIMKWRQSFNNPRPFCKEQGTNRMHIIVMEYIEHNLIKVLYERQLPNNIVKNIIKQLLYVVLQLWYQLHITHGDLKEGNIMLDIGTPKINTYSIGPYMRHVDTLGYEPILIDFQMATVFTIVNSKHVFNDIIKDQPLQILHLYRNYIPEFNELYIKMNSSKTLYQLIKVIDAY